ncbi:hypothetical protein M514_01033 [Trichuris suis]|uniref:Uncharacterized protein n=1 Tax=Trichuris suis TaxID=68888 RepID=A0A085MM24_9BILA|nr:hypothetical protein M513_01033 [Trichuris suis]KFD70535.1 hypothetical protein M514_01033 [Trichuris suis]KHJ47431.1 hypothetical protein D918_02291 [Trichuris suis]
MNPAEKTVSGNQRSPNTKDYDQRTNKAGLRLSQTNDIDKCMKRLEKVHTRWTQLSRSLKQSIGNSAIYSPANILLEMASGINEEEEDLKILAALQKIALHEEETNEEIKRTVIWPADTFCDFKIKDYEAGKLCFETKQRNSSNGIGSSQCAPLDQVMFKLPCSSIFKLRKKQKVPGKNAANEAQLISTMDEALEDATIEYMQHFKKYFELLKKKHDFSVSELGKVSSLEE